MIALIGKEWGYDPSGQPVQYHIYWASCSDALPEDAPVGSRAVLEDGKTVLKGSAGWT
ncbi:MAG: hypothetical protein IJZ37_05825 [Clostridia bacterium]|nr:hypothetical protein [Clostridia bacterium]MBQ8236180.1 hypothetical protein [Clostridia bacterium]MBQ8398602.1 hypothetical protein [Clostridia bacterium]